jgi:hypothetical protein
MGRRLLRGAAIAALVCLFALGVDLPAGRADEGKGPAKEPAPFFVPLPERDRPPGFDDLVERLKARPQTEAVEIGTLDEAALRQTEGPLELKVPVFGRDWVGEPLNRRRSGVPGVRAFATPRRLGGDRATLTVVDRERGGGSVGHLVAQQGGRTLDIRSTGRPDAEGRIMYAAVAARPLPRAVQDLERKREDLTHPPAIRWPGPDRGDRFDLLVGYTQDVLNWYQGDEAPIRDAVAQGVLWAEEVLANSLIPVSLRVRAIVPAGIQERNELGNVTPVQDLLTIVADHQALKIMRYCLRADLVCVLVLNSWDPTLGSISGYANLWSNPLANFATKAYSVVQEFDAGFSLAMAHEMGHNMGCGHAPDDVPVSAGLYDYSFAHKWPETGTSRMMGTVMSRADVWARLFSTPDITWPPGDPSGEPCGSTAENDNARTIRKNRWRIANWGNQLPRPW